MKLDLHIQQNKVETYPHKGDLELSATLDVTQLTVVRELELAKLKNETQERLIEQRFML